MDMAWAYVVNKQWWLPERVGHNNVICHKDTHAVMILQSQHTITKGHNIYARPPEKTGRLMEQV